MSASVAVVGPGSIGGTVAAWLSRSPRVGKLTLCARTPFDALSVETPDGSVIEATPRIVIRPEQIAAPVDWVLVATKAYDAASVARWLAPLVGPDTRVAILQNGVDHVDRFAPFVDRERILPVVVDLPAEKVGPGRFHHRRDGTVVVPDGKAGRAFVDLFADSVIAASTTDDFITVAWTKLALNCTGAVNALTSRPSGVVAAEGVADLMRGLALECIAVGRAVGAKLDDSLADDVVARTRVAPADGVNSILGDRLAGRPMEWDARNGVIVRIGREHGVPTPLNAMAATLLAAI